MANLSKDIQCASSDTQPTMLDRTDFASWQQRIRLRNKKGTHLGPECPRIYSDLSLEEKDRCKRHLGQCKDAPRRVRINQRKSRVTARTEGPNYNQLYAYLKQHETHANENKMTLERFSHHTVNPLALMSNVSNQQRYSPSSSTSSSTHVPQHLADNAHLDSSLSPMKNLIENLTNTLALLTQSYKTLLPQTNNQLRTSSNTTNQATIQDGRVVVQNVQGWPNREQLLFLAGGQDNAIDDDVDEQPAPMTQTMFMANLLSADPVTDEAEPSYDSDILSETALYNGHKIIKDNHIPVIVHNTEDTLEIAEITKRKINDKMKDPECVTHKVKIAPHDYSKENFLATFTPQKQLNPEQIFWSQDLIKLKSEALKEQTTGSRPIKALTVYPPNAPATLAPRVVQIVLWYLDSGCSKHMTEDRSRLTNFVKKFIGTVKFGNDHFGAIMGYGDYVIGDSVIYRVYYVKGLGHNLFSVGQFCDYDLKVAFRKHSCYV
nr:integrase, catalytic region, zinc finger, CCHC-type, peptidase aspartic, catalytic [Tanacetum cinerariifolium]